VIYARYSTLCESVLLFVSYHGHNNFIFNWTKIFYWSNMVCCKLFFPLKWTLIFVSSTHKNYVIDICTINLCTHLGAVGWEIVIASFICTDICNSGTFCHDYCLLSASPEWMAQQQSAPTELCSEHWLRWWALFLCLLNQISATMWFLRLQRKCWQLTRCRLLEQGLHSNTSAAFGIHRFPVTK
jgi:hypothetical protein